MKIKETINERNAHIVTEIRMSLESNTVFKKSNCFQLN